MQLSGGKNMVKSIDMLLNEYRNYSDPIGKINRDIKKKILFPIVKGLYETNLNTSGHLLSAYIYGPSYLSFDYALSYHGLIPERVMVYTNATFNKRKSKIYQNQFGIFTYRDIPKTAYPFGIKAYIDNNYSYFIGSAEKAICDKLYIEPTQTSVKSLKRLLFEDLRIDIESFRQLDFIEMRLLCSKYPSKNIKLLEKYLSKEIIK